MNITISFAVMSIFLFAFAVILGNMSTKELWTNDWLNESFWHGVLLGISIEAVWSLIVLLIWFGFIE